MPVALYHRSLLRTPNSPVRGFSLQFRESGTVRAWITLLVIAFLCLALAGCRPPRTVSPTAPWVFEDLRALAGPGVTFPSLDIIALYTRQAGSDLQIRLDLLDLGIETGGDLYLAFDWKPGGTRELPFEDEAGLEWDALLVLPVRGGPYTLAPPAVKGQAFTPQAAPIPRIARVPWQDMIVVSLNPRTLPGIEDGFSVQVWIAPAGEEVVADSLGPVGPNARPPGRAPLLLAFWNSFPAYTPAQALRRWDGAHTGPFGGRHGLHVLLQASRRARIPVMLLDLKTPESLSALDYLGGLESVREMAGNELLILPDSLPGSPSVLPSSQAFPAWAVGRAAFESRERGSAFGLTASPILYSSSLELVDAVAPPHGLPPYAWIAAPLPGSTSQAQALRWKTYRLLPLPPAAVEHQATPDGLSIDLRLALLANALVAQNGEVPLYILGGDLVDSAWGDPLSARASLKYIAMHPWMQPYDQADLLRMAPSERLELPTQGPGPAHFTQTPSEPGTDPGNQDPVPLMATADPSAGGQIPAGLLQRLELALDSELYELTLAEAAWHAYRSLFAALPPEHPLLPALRASYSNIIDLLLEASYWAARPGSIANCDLDMGEEGHSGCILTSERVFSIYDPLGGRLLALFAYSPDGSLHQLVAPTSQLIVGFGDPSNWDPSAGPGAEPGGIHGAFAGSPPPWEQYNAEAYEDRIVLVSPDGGIVKTFILLEDGLRAEIQVPASPNPFQIPLALDPWERFNPGWGDRYLGQVAGEAWISGIVGGAGVEVRTTTELQADLFSDSRPQLEQVEDPNYPYPPGHYLPFPLALLEVQAQEDFSVEITLSEDLQ